MTDAQFIAWLKTPDAIKTVLVEVTARISGVETVLYLSNRDYVTGGSDTPANTAYLACVKGGVSFNEQLNLSGDPSISYGDIILSNEGGVRDTWLDYVWANRQITVYMGDPRWIRSDFRKIFDGVVADIDSTDPEQLNLHLLDKLAKLNNPMTETTLGDATNNKDQLLPLCFGECFNVKPLLINPATLQYQVNDSAIERIIEVRDNGAPVSFTATVSTGKFVLNQSPFGLVTASVQGDKPATYYNDISNIIQNIVQNYGPTATRFSSGDLDATNLAAFAAAHTAPVGIYADSRLSVISACQQLAASVGAQMVTSSQGLLRLVQIDLPVTGTPTAVTATDFEYHSLKITHRPPVVASHKLGYCKNWTVQSSGLAGGLPPDSAQLFQNEWLTKTQTDSSVATIYKIGQSLPPVLTGKHQKHQRKKPDPTIVQEDTMLLVGTDASTEATRRLSLWKVPRTVYEFKAYSWLMLTELGDPITITHARFGMAGGKTGMVVNIQRDWLAGRITLGVLI